MVESDNPLTVEAEPIESDIAVTVEESLRSMASMPHGDLVAELREYVAQKAVREKMKKAHLEGTGLFVINNPPDPMPDKIVMEPTDAELEHMGPTDCTVAEKRELLRVGKEEVEARDMRERDREEASLTRRDMDRLARMAIGEGDIIAMLTGRFYSRVTNLPADAKIQCVKHEPENRCFVWTVWSMSFPIAEPCSMLPFIEAKMERLKNAEPRPPAVEITAVCNRDWRSVEQLRTAIIEAGVSCGGPIEIKDAIGFPDSLFADFLTSVGHLGLRVRFTEEELRSKVQAWVTTLVRNRFYDHLPEAKNAESRPMA